MCLSIHQTSSDNVVINISTVTERNIVCIKKTLSIFGDRMLTAWCKKILLSCRHKDDYKITCANSCDEIVLLCIQSLNINGFVYSADADADGGRGRGRGRVRRRTRTRVMLHMFRVMLHVFSVMLQVFRVLLHVFPVTLQETRATLHETRPTLQETLQLYKKHLQHYTKHVQHYKRLCPPNTQSQH